MEALKSPGPETVETLASVHLQNERPVWIRAPRDPATARHLTIFLDGELYRDRVEAPRLLDELGDTLADGWFVFVSMCSEEARWRECPCYPPFASFVAEELLPWLAQRHPALRVIRHRTLIGLSYTGLAAAYVAHQFPGAFQKVISQSGSFWSHDGWLIEQFDQLTQRLPTDFYLDVGTRETQINVRHREDVLQIMSQIEGMHRFRDALLRHGHTVRYVEYDGGHEFTAWQKTLPAALQWALPPT